MPHKVDGFELRFPYRRSWNVDRYLGGRKVDQIPVGWVHRSDFRRPRGEMYTDIAFQTPQEWKAHGKGVRFVLALAKAVDETVFPHSIKEIQGIFEVASTGEEIVQGHMRVLILDRVKA